jgi:hypothetical protein
MDKHPKIDRRVNRDRRKNPTPAFTFRRKGLSRSTIRRKSDRETSHYVDLYSMRSILAVFAVLSLSILDAIFTLILVSKGKAREANPLMDFFLQMGPIPFMAAKYVITSICLIWFLIHKNFYVFGRRGSVKYIFISFLFLYISLIIYEIILVYI